MITFNKSRNPIYQINLAYIAIIALLVLSGEVCPFPILWIDCMRNHRPADPRLLRLETNSRLSTAVYDIKTVNEIVNAFVLYAICVGGMDLPDRMHCMLLITLSVNDKLKIFCKNK